MAEPKSNHPVIKTATTTVTTPDQEYEVLLKRFVSVHRAGQARQILTLWKTGQYVDEFMRAQDDANGGKRYGNRDLDRLATDLEAAGVPAARSSLYTCRKIFLVIKEDQIDTLAAQGYSTSHVKLLLPLDDKLRDRVCKELVDARTGDVMSLALLEAKIRREQLSESSAAAEAGENPAEDVAKAAAEGPAKQTGEEAAKTNGYTGEDGEAAPETEGNEPLEAGEGGTAPEGANKASAAPDYSAPPLPPVKELAKVCDKFVTLVPSVSKSLREVQKVGFDTPKQAENWIAARDVLLDALKAVQVHLDGLIESVAEEKRSSGLDSFAADTGEQNTKKGKKGRRR